MKKVIVTGANGFIGAELIKELSKRNVEIIAIVRNRNSDISRIEGVFNTRIIYCNMNEIEKLPDIIPDRDIDTCFYLAWQGS